MGIKIILFDEDSFDADTCDRIATELNDADFSTNYRWEMCKGIEDKMKIITIK